VQLPNRRDFSLVQSVECVADAGDTGFDYVVVQRVRNPYLGSVQLCRDVPWRSFCHIVLSSEEPMMVPTPETAMERRWHTDMSIPADQKRKWTLRGSLTMESPLGFSSSIRRPFLCIFRAHKRSRIFSIIPACGGRPSFMVIRPPAARSDQFGDSAAPCLRRTCPLSLPIRSWTGLPVHHMKNSTLRQVSYHCELPANSRGLF
jgi:hypothetical protein